MAEKRTVNTATVQQIHHDSPQHLWDDLYSAGFLVRLDPSSGKLKLLVRSWVSPAPALDALTQDRIITHRSGLAALAKRRDQEEEQFMSAFLDGSGRGQREVAALFGRSEFKEAWNTSWGRGEDSQDQA